MRRFGDPESFLGLLDRVTARFAGPDRPPASDVTAAEAAMMAGLLKAPSYFAPTANLERSRERASVILGLMHDQRYLTDEEYAVSSNWNGRRVLLGDPRTFTLSTNFRF